MLQNPFIIAGLIPSEYFCDRVKETNDLIKLLVNHNNVVLISPRRMGKSGLIHHCFEKPELKKNFSCLYVDILQTSSIKEFVYLLGKAIYDNLVPKTTSWIKRFFRTLRSLQGKISFDAISGYPSFSLMLGELSNPEITLQEIFAFINKYDKRVIVAIDEFQQICKYPEKNVEAILRSYIQQSRNVNFIYAGSERHIMQEMFLTYNRPFYQSSSFMVLEPIPKDIYVEFAQQQFENYGKEIDADALNYLYDRFAGHTYYLQKTLNVTFANSAIAEKCNIEAIDRAISGILEDNSTIYRQMLSNLGESVKEFLYALALEGETTGVTSSSFLKKYSLKSASSVQAATRLLLDKDFITKEVNRYSVSDKFLALWIKKIYG